jgi:hypothetical protein
MRRAEQFLAWGMTRLSIIAAGVDGHRREYIALFRRMAEGGGVACEIRSLRLTDIFNYSPIFSPMLEEHTVGFLVIAALRALWGRRSCALMFRPGEAAHATSPRHLIKKILLKAVRPLPTITIATIMPFELDPAFSGIAREWIHDPQLWDLGAETSSGATPLGLALQAQAAGRRVVVALGAQNPDKGFDFFGRVWSERSELRRSFLFVAAGKVAAASRDAADRFASEGGMLVDRFISDEELRDLYREADLVWACYAPAYDQASGIFGRSVQMGRPVVVRQGAYMERQAEVLRHPAAAVAWDNVDAVVTALRTPPAKVEAASERVSAMRSRSVDVLARALKISLSEATL